MKKTLIVLLFVAISGNLLAQEGIRIGLKGSFSSTWLFNKNVSDQNDELDYASSFGTAFGAQGVFMFAETYGLSAEILFASHRQKYDGYVGSKDNTFTNEIKLGYLDIPVLFRVSSPKGPYFEIGPQFSLLMGAKETFELQNGPSSSNYTDKDFKDNVASFSMGAVLGFGVDIKLSDQLALNTGLRFGYMFTDATTEYSEAEALKASSNDELSNVALFSHLNESGNFDYQKSNRAFGGLQIGLQYRIER